MGKFLKAPLKELRSGRHNTLLEEFKFLLSHVCRHHNELIFMKCESGSCNHCTQHPVRATDAFSLIQHETNMFYPLSSTQHPSHFCTFLEMCNKKVNELPTADQHLPSFNSELGSCPYCCEHVFLSKTEKKRHFQVFHPPLV